ncbi:unnamed protein product, partial [Coregonus sp. 'balchen']
TNQVSCLVCLLHVVQLLAVWALCRQMLHGSLTELLLDHNHLTVLESGTFHSLDSLQKLNLSSNLISTVKLRALGYLTALCQINLEGNHLTSLGSGLFTTLRSLVVVGLQGNMISYTEPGVFTPMSSLNLLDLVHNHLGTLGYRTLLIIHTPSFHGNPWHCDCKLQRVFRNLCIIHRVFLDDYQELKCSDPVELKGRSMGEVDDELCVGGTVMVLILTVTVVITVVAPLSWWRRTRRIAWPWTGRKVWGWTPTVTMTIRAVYFP